jgi:putative addiction module CopG family antidote
VTNTPLPPHLAQFIRDQIAAGNFRSESELIHTALHLLEEQSRSEAAYRDWLKQEIDRGLESRPSEPVTKQFWQQLRARIQAAPHAGDD